MAARAGWLARKRERGKGREYHISSLPREAQGHLHHQHAIAETMQRAREGAEAEREERMAALVAGAEAFGREDHARWQGKVAARRRRHEQGLAAWAALPEGARKARAKARLWLLEHLWEFRRAHSGTKEATRAAFAHAINTGELRAPDTVSPHIPLYQGRRALTGHTLARWERDYDQDGLAALMDGYGNRKGGSKIERNEGLKKVVLGCVFRAPHITPLKIRQYLAAAHPGLHGLVSVKGIERFQRRWKKENAQLWCYLTNPDEWKNTYMVAFGSHSERIERLNQVWEMDSTPGDWMLTDGRHVVIGVIDLYSRRLRFRVSKSSRAMALCAALRDALMAWGVPEAVRTDNGADYVSRQLDEVLRGLDVAHELCVPFASEQKGTIERAMRTLSHGILDLLPGFAGHNVAERQVIRARQSFAQRVMQPGEVIEVALSAAELQEKLDQWAEYVYARDAHNGLGGKTPFEVAAAWTRPVRRLGDERALDALLAEIAGVRTVSKKGIRFGHYHYIAPELTAHVGEDVRLKHDEDDIGRLYVYALGGQFICAAVAHELLGISRREAALAAKSEQKRLLARQREDLKDSRRAVKENIAEAVLRHRIEQGANLIAFPQRAEEHTTPALEAAADAARALDAPRAAEFSAEVQAVIDRQTEQFYAAAQPREERLDMFRSNNERMTVWDRLDDRVNAGGALSAKEDEFYKFFAAQDYCRNVLQMRSEFESAMRIRDGKK